ncbi:hypothetical protein [Cryobacterium sp. BB736]|uniref:hypothetical protein n=1 Tax=Cryobacterium sp. BB736 TaxID=2746963 RepID=UPI0018740907|nr:hypothetical protein [Cryobacterium sp. BB736]
MGFRMRAVALTAVALLLAGCVPNEPTVTARPPAVDPVFASDEEALAAAVEAYERYLSAFDLIASEGGHDPERIASTVTEAGLPGMLQTFAEMRDASKRTEGATRFDSPELQSYFEEPPGTAVVVIYVCVDRSDIRVLPSGAANQSERRTFEVTLASSESDSSILLLERSELWPNSTVC